MEDEYDSNLDESIFHTQGGGTVRWDEYQQTYIFVDPPENFPKYQAGDFMPIEWGVS